MNVRTKADLLQMQSCPLNVKIGLTKARIREWVREYGTDGVFVSFSGGKDSTVLLHIVREMYPDIEAVFVNTGLEYPEIQKFVKTFDNVTILRPKMRFDEVLKNYGYPIISKSVSNCVRGAKMGQQSRINLLNGLDCDGSERHSKFSKKKYKPLLDVDFAISEQCCDVMKKKPSKQYQRETGKKPILATMAVESMLREKTWLQNGCNAFDSKDPKSTPMAFWTEQDVLQYIKRYMQPHLDRTWEKAMYRTGGVRRKARKELKRIGYRKSVIASVYGDIVYVDNPEQMRLEEYSVDGCGTEKLTTTGCDRTGCIFCAFGCHLEKEPSRFQMLKETHPRQYEYCIDGGEYVYIGTAYTSDGEPREIPWINDDNSPMTNEQIEEFITENKDKSSFKFEKIWKPNKQGLGMGHIFDELNKIYGDGFIKY